VSTKKLTAAAKSDAAKYHVPLQDASGEMASTGELRVYCASRSNFQF